MVARVIDRVEDPDTPVAPAWLAGGPESEAPWPTVDELLAELEMVMARAAAGSGTSGTSGAGDAVPSVAGCPTPTDAWRLDDAGLMAELRAAQAAMTVAHARWLALLAEAERRGAVLREQHMTAASWLAAGTSHSARTARADVRLAGLVAASGPVAERLGQGLISVEQAGVIVQGLERLPEDLDRAQRDEVEAHLAELATEFGPTALRRLVNHAVEVVAPQVVEDHARRALDRAERAQRATRHVGWRTDADDGGLRFWGKLPAAEGELFKNHLSALASAQRDADSTMDVDTSQGQALADALSLVVSHHASCQGGPVRGGDHTRVVVTLSLDDLLSGGGVGRLIESDELVTAGQARRLACTAGLVPLVLDGDSMPLDLGRSQRLFTPHQRLAMAVRDVGCTFPGCDRPPADCEAHHAVLPWQAGGRTDLADGVLLCPHHHHLVEPLPDRPPEKNWRITFDDRGRPVFHTPVGRGGQRIVRQHHRYRC